MNLSVSDLRSGNSTRGNYSKQVWIRPAVESKPPTKASTWRIMVKCRSHVVTVFFGTMRHGCLLLVVLLSCLHVNKFAEGLFLNPPQLLISYNYGIPSNFTLSIIGDADKCSFEWKSMNPHIVQVDPICESSKCCREAVVSVVSSSSERIVTEVIAKNKDGTKILKCDVTTDDPKSIELSALNSNLFRNGQSEIVTVIAKDRYGNVFSSINGLHFEWKAFPEVPYIYANEYRNQEKNDHACVLRPFPDSKYNSALQRRGMLGHKILFEPTTIGRCDLVASLKRRDLEDLNTPVLTFHVDVPRAIYPSNSIYLLKFASVVIHAEEERKKIEDIISPLIPVDPAYLEVKDTVTLFYEKDKITATALEFGIRSFSIARESDDDSHNGNFAGIIYVVTPTELSFRFRISSGDFTTLQEMQMYVITVDIYDNNGNVIFPSDNLRIATTFPSSLFYVHTTTSNGTYHVVQALVPGKGSIKAEFKGVIKSDGTLVKDYDLLSTIELTICQKLEISPPFVLLPTASDSKPLHKIRLMASGGTGHYKWTTNIDDEMATIEFDEQISHVGYLHIHKESDFTVILSDSNNPNFLATSLVSVQPVLDIEVYSTIVESEVGNVIILPVALLAYEHKDKKIIRKFDDCSRIKPTVEIIEKNIITLDDEPHIPAFGRGCLSLQFRCRAPGYSRINIFYDSKHDNDVITHKTTTVLACFKPLKPVHPVRVAVLPIGGTKEIAMDGGPRKWPLFKEGHYTKLEASRPELLDIEIIKDPIRYNKDLTVFRVICKELGENNLVFRIGNEPSATNPHPAKQETSIKFFCSEPHSIHLKLPQKKKNNLLEDNIVKVPFYGEKLFSVDVWIKDSMGRKLSNISSLLVEFDDLDTKFVEDAGTNELLSYENAVAGYRKITRDYKEFKMTGETGDLKLTAKVKSYREEVLKKLEIAKPKRKFKEISTTLDLKLVSLRDINAGLYLKEGSNNPVQQEEGTCDEDSCKS